jgi:predicted MPP superfamily phosphohydrolase
MKTHLVIPDGHAKPSEDLSRFDLLNKFIKDLKPDVIVNIGDAADMHSLNSFDKGKGSFHGASYEADINCAVESFDRTFHRAPKNIRKVFCVGNHEYRITRAVEQAPEMEGNKFGISMGNLELDKHFNDVVDYEGAAAGTIDIDGVVYAHYLTSGAMGRPISGDNHARSLLVKGHQSATVGHSHFLDYSTHVTSSGKRLHGLVCGSFKGKKNDAYAGTSARNYWRGVAVKRLVNDGQYDLQMVSMKQLEALYKT